MKKNVAFLLTALLGSTFTAPTLCAMMDGDDTEEAKPLTAAASIQQDQSLEDQIEALRAENGRLKQQQELDRLKAENSNLQEQGATAQATPQNAAQDLLSGLLGRFLNSGDGQRFSRSLEQQQQRNPEDDPVANLFGAVMESAKFDGKSLAEHAHENMKKPEMKEERPE